MHIVKRNMASASWSTPPVTLAIRPSVIGIIPHLRRRGPTGAARLVLFRTRTLLFVPPALGQHGGVVEGRRRVTDQFDPARGPCRGRRRRRPLGSSRRSPGAGPSRCRPRVRARRGLARDPRRPRAPPAREARIAAGSSWRGLSSVTTTWSAPCAAVAPSPRACRGRLGAEHGDERPAGAATQGGKRPRRPQGYARSRRRPVARRRRGRPAASGRAPAPAAIASVTCAGVRPSRRSARAASAVFVRLWSPAGTRRARAAPRPGRAPRRGGRGPRTPRCASPPRSAGGSSASSP